MAQRVVTWFEKGCSCFETIVTVVGSNPTCAACGVHWYANQKRIEFDPFDLAKDHEEMVNFAYKATRCEPGEADA